MIIPTHPMILAYEIFYFEGDKIFYLPGGKQRNEITSTKFNTKIAEYREQKIEYMLLYDYMFDLKKDKWEALPSEIDIDEIDFLYELSIITEDEYMRFYYLYTEYAKPKL